MLNCYIRPIHFDLIGTLIVQLNNCSKIKKHGVGADFNLAILQYRVQSFFDLKQEFRSTGDRNGRTSLFSDDKHS